MSVVSLVGFAPSRLVNRAGSAGRANGRAGFLDEAVRAVCDGWGGVVVIEGLAGIGKTPLLDEAAAGRIRCRHTPRS